ncbi:hypothetical protein IPH25_04650 [bacterium]|nr:MAG: hypothetical protein IPG37_01645 [bacterium]QQR61731.1 MAG: hypothetical protein IPH25_04650 [bacterium]QQR62701.1 MAG: hypothetical protein IPH67_04785 [bacterium]
MNLILNLTYKFKRSPQIKYRLPQLNQLNNYLFNNSKTTKAHRQLHSSNLKILNRQPNAVLAYQRQLDNQHPTLVTVEQQLNHKLPGLIKLKRFFGDYLPGYPPGVTLYQNLASDNALSCFYQLFRFNSCIL